MSDMKMQFAQLLAVAASVAGSGAAIAGEQQNDTPADEQRVEAPTIEEVILASGLHCQYAVGVGISNPCRPVKLDAPDSETPESQLSLEDNAPTIEEVILASGLHCQYAVPGSISNPCRPATDLPATGEETLLDENAIFGEFEA